MTKILATLIVLGAVLGGALLTGIIIQDAWGWFIVPLGAPPITLVHAIGLSAFIAYLKMRNPADEPKRTSEELRHRFGLAIVTALISWAAMAFIAIFMP